MKLRQIPLFMLAMLTIVLPLTSITAETPYLTYVPLIFYSEQAGIKPQNRTENLTFYQSDYLI